MDQVGLGAYRHRSRLLVYVRRPDLGQSTSFSGRVNRPRNPKGEQTGNQRKSPWQLHNRRLIRISCFAGYCQAMPDWQKPTKEERRSSGKNNTSGSAGTRSIPSGRQPAQELRSKVGNSACRPHAGFRAPEPSRSVRNAPATIPQRVRKSRRQFVRQ